MDFLHSAMNQHVKGKSSEQTPLSGQTSLFDEENFAGDEDEDLPC